MKSALLLTAMLSGLCAEVIASPVSNISKDRPAPAIQPDLHFNAASLDDSLLGDDQDQAGMITTGIELDETIAPRQLAVIGNQAAGSLMPRFLRVPEPPPVTLIAIGLGFLGTVVLWRRARRQKRRSRRRTVVRMREITAGR